MGKILGLDVSTKTIGVALFDEDAKLKILKNVTPKPKPVPKDKLELLFKKAHIFEDFLKDYVAYDIDTVVIEEPLLSSNNKYTVGTLLRFNGMVAKACYDILGVVPEFISSYDARKYAFPELMEHRVGKNGKPGKNPVLFGGYEKGVDKKMVIWEKVADREPQVVWLYDKYNRLKKENFDMTDAYAAVMGYIKKKATEDLVV
tara:strand:- start:48 stop:653 length:606 start_codon:yes stop_codon:yes gene_type:complete